MTEGRRKIFIRDAHTHPNTQTHSHTLTDSHKTHE